MPDIILTPLADYFVEYWIDEKQFKKSVWNHYHTTRVRTNNNAEGYNSRLC